MNRKITETEIVLTFEKLHGIKDFPTHTMKLMKPSSRDPHLHRHFSKALESTLNKMSVWSSIFDKNAKKEKKYFKHSQIMTAFGFHSNFSCHITYCRYRQF